MLLSRAHLTINARFTVSEDWMVVLNSEVPIPKGEQKIEFKFIL